ncbi:hypothetical protein [Shouchella patagoniensis]|uniref:hypothetical protein n=1 Tax=Shouchella patagoniensis TaxID=228576 RepID=UPI001115DE76|nr:hypothetical protein [Shouchella patagoniensis]
MKDELLHSDPMLPPEFLPGDWLGIDVLDTLTHQLTRLSALLGNDDAYVDFIQE